ncbi:MAG: hypothetical protein KDJ23_00125 [Rhodoblastus sp.]|nr:hypothetical protein [Rhodoblastus sp.]MCB9999814.1 hypothetical protein [Methylobacteriaceae bacterium]MCC0001516.1 hypothetical protein [Methylobacteriaceae bacterium]
MDIVADEPRKITVYEDVAKRAFYVIDSADTETLHPVGYAEGDEDDRESAKDEAYSLAIQMADDRLISREEVEYGGPWEDA